MKTTQEQILANVTEAREVAVAALRAAKAALLAYQHASDFAISTTEYDRDLMDASNESRTGLYHVADALDAVVRYK